MELNCIGWASALMMCVYDFVKESEACHGLPPFDVPHMQYVQCGLAISKSEAHHHGNSAYLLEEYIETDMTSSKNWFVKYLNNSSARPRQFEDSHKTERAQFLSFAQHVQFWKTEGLAFVSDFQGTQDNSQICVHCFYLLFRWPKAFNRSTDHYTPVSYKFYHAYKGIAKAVRTESLVLFLTRGIPILTPSFVTTSVINSASFISYLYHKSYLPVVVMGFSNSLPPLQRLLQMIWMTFLNQYYPLKTKGPD